MWMIFVGLMVVTASALLIGPEIVARLGILFAPVWALLCLITAVLSPSALSLWECLAAAGYAFGGAIVIAGFGIALAWVVDGLPHRQRLG